MQILCQECKNFKCFPLQNFLKGIPLQLYMLKNVRRNLIYFPFQIKINYIILNMTYRKLKKKTNTSY